MSQHELSQQNYQAGLNISNKNLCNMYGNAQRNTKEHENSLEVERVPLLWYGEISKAQHCQKEQLATATCTSYAIYSRYLVTYPAIVGSGKRTVVFQQLLEESGNKVRVQLQWQRR